MTWDRYDREWIRQAFGHCPAGCSGRGVNAILPVSAQSVGVIYRSSKRSVTFRCFSCGLLWTMTWHQMAKAARRLEARGQDDSEVADIVVPIADRVREDEPALIKARRHQARLNAIADATESGDAP
jgi:uncharacterized Zn finger protein